MAGRRSSAGLLVCFLVALSLATLAFLFFSVLLGLPLTSIGDPTSRSSSDSGSGSGNHHLFDDDVLLSLSSNHKPATKRVAMMMGVPAGIDDDVVADIVDDFDNLEDEKQRTGGSHSLLQGDSTADKAADKDTYPRVLVLVLATASAESVERVQSIVRHWPNHPNVDLAIVARGLELDDILTPTAAAEPPAQQRQGKVMFLHVPEEVDVVPRDQLRLKVFAMWQTAANLHGDNYDFFFKVDDDTFVDALALLAMLSHLDASKHVYLGRRAGLVQLPRALAKHIPLSFLVPTEPSHLLFYHGGGGYIVSRPLLQAMSRHLPACTQLPHPWEDAAFAVCVVVAVGAVDLEELPGFDPFVNGKDDRANEKVLDKLQATTETTFKVPSLLLHVSFHSVTPTLAASLAARLRPLHASTPLPRLRAAWRAYMRANRLVYSINAACRDSDGALQAHEQTTCFSNAFLLRPRLLQHFNTESPEYCFPPSDSGVGSRQSASSILTTATESPTIAAASANVLTALEAHKTNANRGHNGG
ncbi:hypothetical protein PTSG_11494, partial [Salpingoeca rosetta]